MLCGFCSGMLRIDSKGLRSQQWKGPECLQCGFGCVACAAQGQCLWGVDQLPDASKAKVRHSSSHFGSEDHASCMMMQLREEDRINCSTARGTRSDGLPGLSADVNSKPFQQAMAWYIFENDWQKALTMVKDLLEMSSAPYEFKQAHEAAKRKWWRSNGPITRRSSAP